MKSCAVIIVTHNSQAHIPKAMQALKQQTVLPARILIVDSHSARTDYVRAYAGQKSINVLLAKENVGFCRGNNMGYAELAKKGQKECEYVLFLNPDAFLSPDFIEKAMAFMENPQYADCGAITGLAEGYDIQAAKPTGKYDSTGVFRTWYGRWYDRDQGREIISVQYREAEALPAICGALFFCRKKALDTILLRQEEVFDNTLYMYKEDIDLSLRLKVAGWKLYLAPELRAYHCRGWHAERAKVAKKMRMLSAYNELRIHLRNFSPCSAYSLLKCAGVKIFNL